MKKLWGPLALGLVLLATLFGTELNAGGTATPTANCNGAGGQSQLGQYCGSMQSSQQGSDANSSLWKVWGGVSTVCISACMSGNPAGAETCNISSKGGSVTEGVVTKNYASGLTSIAQSQGTSALSSKLNGGEKSQTGENGNSTDKTPEQKAAADKKKARNIACSGAAIATGKAITNYRSMQSAAQAAEQTKKAATSLDSSAKEAAGGGTTAASLANSRGSVEGSGREAMSAATAGSAASICASAKQTSSTVETLQCAVASDPTLPAMVTSGQLPKAFTKASGTDFSAFGNNPSQSPADAIAQAASGSLSTSDGLKVAALLKTMEGDLMNDDGAYYASAGAGGAGAPDESASAQIQLQDQLKEMLAKSQADQAHDGQPAPTGVSAVIFANQNRSPASVTEDKTLSIFDRVTYRYYFVVKQLRVENFQ